ncbi:hypothetical protein [Methanolacinia petrolearia]|uniref:hypothetical protein n=1 Tax=Methanolacinia petrolearia TaxID=54120 RepID=UPI003BA8A0D9
MNVLMQYRRAAVLLIVLLFLPAVAAAGSQWETKEIPSENESVLGGAISGEYVIFLTSGGMNQSDNRIKLYDVSSGDSNIIGAPSEGMMVTGEDLSGDCAVWFETESRDNYEENDTDTKPNSIYLMNIAEDNTSILNLPGDAEWPKIEGNKIFWSNSSEESLETNFCIYDNSTGESEYVLAADYADSADIVFDNGNVAYENMTSLNLFNIESGEETVIYAFESDND